MPAGFLPAGKPPILPVKPVGKSVNSCLNQVSLLPTGACCRFLLAATPWRPRGGTRKCPHSHSLPACPPALCSPQRAGDVTTKPAKLFSVRCAALHICVWRCHGGLFRRLAHLCGWSSSVPSSICLPLPSAERLPPHPLGFYPGMMVRMSPAATNLVAAGLSLRPPPSHMAGTSQGRCRARLFSGARLAVIILHFPPHPRPPLRSRAHGCLCPPRPLGRCCAPTPPRTRVKSGGISTFSSSYAQNYRAMLVGVEWRGERPRARFGTRVAVRCAVGR